LQDFLVFDGAWMSGQMSELRQVALQASVFDDAAVLEAVEDECQQIDRLPVPLMFCNW
jgi:hypothetical protein